MPQVYLINLVRRPDRKEMMEKALSELGVSYKYFPAVDGKYVTLHNIIFSLSLCNKGHVKLTLELSSCVLEIPDGAFITFGRSLIDYSTFSQVYPAN